MVEHSIIVPPRVPVACHGFIRVGPCASISKRFQVPVYGFLNTAVQVSVSRLRSLRSLRGGFFLTRIDKCYANV